MKSTFPKAAKTILSLTVLGLLCACHKENQPPAPTATVPAKSGIVSAEKTSFDEVTAKLDPGGSLYVYLSTEKVLSGLSDRLNTISNFLGSLPGIPGAQVDTINRVFDVVSSCVKDSGVEQISGLGMSSIARETNFYYSKLVVHHYPGQDQGMLWSVMGKTPHPLKELDMLPEDTVMATVLDLDLPLLWSDVQSHLRALHLPVVDQALDQLPSNFAKHTQLDFQKTLDSLSGTYGVILTLDPEKKISLPLPSGAMEIPSPGLAIFAKVNSDLIFDRVDQLAKGNPLVVRLDNSELRMRTMTIPLPLPIDLRPSIARTGDYLILATSDNLIQDLLAVKDGKKKGYKTTAEFARLSQGIPDQGNNFSLVSARFIKSMEQIQQQAMTNQGTLSAAQVKTLQEAFNKGGQDGSYSVGANGSDGWVGYANGSQTIQSAVLPIVAGVGLAAAIAIPNFIKARQAAQGNPTTSAADPQMREYNRIVANLRQLQTAKQLWASQKGKEKGDAVTMEDLAPYLKSGLIKPIADEEYNPQPVGTAPTARLAHELRGHAAGSEITAPARKKRPAA